MRGEADSRRPDKNAEEDYNEKSNRLVFNCRWLDRPPHAAYPGFVADIRGGRDFGAAISFLGENKKIITLTD